MPMLDYKTCELARITSTSCFLSRFHAMCRMFSVSSSFASTLETAASPTLLSNRRTCAQSFHSQVAVGEDVKVVGNLEELGAWDVSEGLALQWAPGHRWVGSTSITIPHDAEFLYKLVKTGLDGANIEWEEGDDLSLIHI